MAQQIATGRLDRIIRELEKLHSEAQDIFDAHVDFVRCRSPGIPFGILKACEITNPAGSALNYIAALKMLREKFTDQ
jgi:hypothetical protein